MSPADRARRRDSTCGRFLQEESGHDDVRGSRAGNAGGGAEGGGGKGKTALEAGSWRRDPQPQPGACPAPSASHVLARTVRGAISAQVLQSYMAQEVQEAAIQIAEEAVTKHKQLKAIAGGPGTPSWWLRRGRDSPRSSPKRTDPHSLCPPRRAREEGFRRPLSDADGARGRVPLHCGVPLRLLHHARHALLHPPPRRPSSHRHLPVSRARGAHMRRRDRGSGRPAQRRHWAGLETPTLRSSPLQVQGPAIRPQLQAEGEGGEEGRGGEGELEFTYETLPLRPCQFSCQTARLSGQGSPREGAETTWSVRPRRRSRGR